MRYEYIKLPAQGARITVNADGSLDVPDRPIILSAERMLRYIKWPEAADHIIKGVANTIAAKELTYDRGDRREQTRTRVAAQCRRGNAEADPGRDPQELLGLR